MSKKKWTGRSRSSERRPHVLDRPAGGRIPKLLNAGTGANRIFEAVNTLLILFPENGLRLPVKRFWRSA
ncbi:MAG TPA: hypothetical protein DDZ51_07050 [Planctomycetaceae bacterium]|nr:hypothetical protein [Planctomycetaceae bacterium]